MSRREGSRGARSLQDVIYQRCKERGMVREEPANVNIQSAADRAEASRQRLFALGRLPAGELNKTEAKYAAHLDELKLAGDVVWYSFNGMKFRLAPNTHLSIDFAVLYADQRLVMVDVKGSEAVIQDDASVKMRLAASMFPFPFMYAFPPAKGQGWRYKEIS